MNWWREEFGNFRRSGTDSELSTTASLSTNLPALFMRPDKRNLPRKTLLIPSRDYTWRKKRRLLSRQESAKYFSSESLAKPDVRLRVMRFLFRFLLRIVGADRYTVLMKYLSYVSILRNQGDVFLK